VADDTAVQGEVKWDLSNYKILYSGAGGKLYLEEPDCIQFLFSFLSLTDFE
jgi:hypothetical protein